MRSQIPLLFGNLIDKMKSLRGVKKMNVNYKNYPRGRWDKTFCLLQQKLPRLKKEPKVDIPLFHFLTPVVVELLSDNADPSEVLVF